MILLQEYKRLSGKLGAMVIYGAALGRVACVQAARVSPPCLEGGVDIAVLETHTPLPKL